MSQEITQETEIFVWSMIHSEKHILGGLESRPLNTGSLYNTLAGGLQDRFDCVRRSPEKEFCLLEQTLPRGNAAKNRSAYYACAHTASQLIKVKTWTRFPI